MSPTAVGDAKFGCGYEGSHLAHAATTDELTAAVSDSAVTCIKLLANTTYALLSHLFIDRTLAIVSEDGQATLDGEGVTQHLWIDFWRERMISGKNGDVALSQLSFRNGSADNVRCAASPRLKPQHGASVLAP